MFKRMALSYHKAKGQTTEDIDKWLEKELLTKEQYDKIYSDKRIDSREQNMTTSNKINENEYKNKLWKGIQLVQVIEPNLMLADLQMLTTLITVNILFKHSVLLQWECHGGNKFISISFLTSI